MISPAVVAHQMDPATGFIYSLLVDGVDVIRAVSFDGIRITEAGPGAVSSITFPVIDPDAAFVMADDARIEMHDHVRDLPVFLGFGQALEAVPAYAGDGRDYVVTGYGIEARLDQIIVPVLGASFAVTSEITTGGLDIPITLGAALQGMAAHTGLRASRRSGGAPTADQGISVLSFPVAEAVTVNVDGLSVRQAFERWWENVDTFGQILPPPRLTVDFRGSIRAHQIGYGFKGANYPTDWDTLTITDAANGTGVAATNLRWTHDTSPGQVVTAVYVKGATAAVTGWIVGDTTKGRGEAYVADSGITSVSAMQQAANSILGRRGTGIGRGTLELENFVPIDAHPGGELRITNVGLGWSSKSFTIGQIDKTFQKTGRQNWTVAFSDDDDVPSTGRPSAMRLIRSLTAGTR